MASILSEYLKLFQNLSLPGFIFLLSILILFQAYTEFNLIKTLTDYKEFISYIGIIVIILSFTLGLLIYLAEQEIKPILADYIKGLRYEQHRCLDDQKAVDQKTVDNVYGVLIMIRHLMYSIACLVIAISIYLKKQNKNLKHNSLFLYFYSALFLILSFAYFRIKILLDDWESRKNNNTGFVICVFVFLFLSSLIMILRVDYKNKNKNEDKKKIFNWLRDLIFGTNNRS